MNSLESTLEIQKPIRRPYKTESSPGVASFWRTIETLSHSFSLVSGVPKQIYNLLYIYPVGQNSEVLS